MRSSDRRHLVLATDLDGTFLGGPAASRELLYEWIESNRSDVTLIFVTGRDLPFVRALVRDTPVPQPDFVIGDVGTTIAGGPTIEPIDELERPIADLWGNSGARVRSLLAEEPGLQLQDTAFRYRVSYFYDPQTLSPDAAKIVGEAGFDCLLSADTFFDVLPRGVSKGPTLVRLIKHLRLDPRDVLVAGDTLNDLSLFESGFAGVAVGNSEPALRARIADLATVFFSKEAGAAGILDAIARRTRSTGGAP
ncbi:MULTISPECIES: HAD family hydrolase [unclassified Chelatococcus]|uniref:HAD family hydrolase n=1 Tax=unclassified Chelatococcus TaxID=2638111 RepID=UPI001BCB5602|nr:MULTISPECIES: HAD family hydrolase [unclassified Chelatococcus]MBS7701200.1 HAD hydrolase family protein [Chelatococcus sp. YT9]MBX3557331.1 HAD hydrolase family protein [Chelatococcus sp.]